MPKPTACHRSSEASDEARQRRQDRKKKKKKVKQCEEQRGNVEEQMKLQDTGAQEDFDLLKVKLERLEERLVAMEELQKEYEKDKKELQDERAKVTKYKQVVDKFYDTVKGQQAMAEEKEREALKLLQENAFKAAQLDERAAALSTAILDLETSKQAVRMTQASVLELESQVSSKQADISDLESQLKASQALITATQEQLSFELREKDALLLEKEKDTEDSWRMKRLICSLDLQRQHALEAQAELTREKAQVQASLQDAERSREQAEDHLAAYRIQWDEE